MWNMRRKDRQISRDESESILKNGEYGVLSTISENGYPYGAPVNYCKIGNNLYFHCAEKGQKINNLRHNDKVSFCVVGYTQLLPEDYSTLYESVIVFGRAYLVNDEEEKRNALMELIEKYAAEYKSEAENYFKKWFSKTAVYGIKIEHITGKARRE
ncbi:MAG: pyridoxamine 5'-phosphate oxidase family protein [Calditrichia bacterium]